MCHFITAVLPRTAPVEELDAIARTHGKQFKPLVNPSIGSQIKPSEAYFLATAGVCDCGTALGVLARTASAPQQDRAMQERRLRAKGWSEAKIARALAQKEHHAQVAGNAKQQASRSDAQGWIDLLSAVMASGKTPSVGLLVHWYSGSLESRVTLHGRDIVERSWLTAETLMQMKEDVLYEFR